MPYPILAPRDTWYTQGGSGILRSTITEATFRDSYAPAGPVAAQWDASAARDGSVTAYIEGTRLTIAGNGSGKVRMNPDSSFLFCDTGKQDFFRSLATVSGFEVLDSSGVTTLKNAFTFCNSLTEIPGFDTLNVTGCTGDRAMQGVFSGCGFTELDLSGLDMTGVTDVNHFFADCANMRSLKLPKNLSAKNYAAAFNDCTHLEEIDVRNVDFSNALALSQLWERCSALKRIIGHENMDVSRAGSEKVAGQTAFAEIFSGTAIEILDLSRWDMTHAYDVFGDSTAGMFLGMKWLKKISLPPTYRYEWYEQYPQNAPLLPVPDPQYIPGADGNWYTATKVPYDPASGPSADTIYPGTDGQQYTLTYHAYTPVEILHHVPATYYATREEAERDQDVLLKYGTVSDIAQSVRDQTGSPEKMQPSDIPAAVRSISPAVDPTPEADFALIYEETVAPAKAVVEQTFPDQYKAIRIGVKCVSAKPEKHDIFLAAGDPWTIKAVGTPYNTGSGYDSMMQMREDHGLWDITGMHGYDSWGTTSVVGPLGCATPVSTAEIASLSRIRVYVLDGTIDEGTTIKVWGRK